jgi:hypothetical protein
MTREVAGYGKQYPVAAPDAKPAEQPAPAEQPGIGEQLADATKNDVAGIAEGAAALPDMAAEGVGKVLSAVPNAISHALSAAGHEDAANWIQDNITHHLANPVQIGDAIESAVPTPDTASGKVNRFIGQLVGGAVTVPAAATEAAIAKIVGEAPKVPVVAKATAKTLNQDFARRRSAGHRLHARRSSQSDQVEVRDGNQRPDPRRHPLGRAGREERGLGGAAVDRIAANIGSLADKTGAGQAAQRGARQFVGSTTETLNNLESKIPIHADAPAVVANTRSALTNLSESFASNPKLAEAFRDPRVSKFLDALTPQPEPTGVLDAAGQADHPQRGRRPLLGRLASFPDASG